MKTKIKQTSSEVPENYLDYEKIKKKYPNEWILLGGYQDIKDKGGTVLYHSKDKKEVCYKGRDKVKDHKKITVIYTGELKSVERIGILKRI